MVVVVVVVVAVAAVGIGSLGIVDVVVVLTGMTVPCLRLPFLEAEACLLHRRVLHLHPIL